MQMFLHGLKDILGLFLIFIVFIIGGGMLLVGGAYIEIATGRQKKRFLFLDQYVLKRGYRLLNPELHEWIMRLSVFEFAKKINSAPLKKGVEGLSSIREFQKGRQTAVEAFALEIAGNETLIFSYSYSDDAGGPGDLKPYTINLKVAKMSQKSGADFRLERKDLAARVGYGVNQILKATQTEGATHYLDFREHPNFAKHYYVTASNEETTMQFFSAQKILQLENHPLQGTLISAPSYWIYLEHGKFTDEKSYDDFITHAKNAYETLLLT